jgi:hypothetical protein
VQVRPDWRYRPASGGRYTGTMRESRSEWRDPELVATAADEPAPLPRAALLPLAAGLVIVVLIAMGYPGGWLEGVALAAIAALPTAGALSLMFGAWNMRGPSRRNWAWGARYQRRRSARRPADIRIVEAKGEITKVSGEPAAVAGGEVIPARPGSPPLPPPGAYRLRWQESAHGEVDPVLLSARPFRPGARWPALAGAILFGSGAAIMVIPFRYTFSVQDWGGSLALAFFLLMMTAELAVPAWLLAAEWRYLRPHSFRRGRATRSRQSIARSG